MSDQSADRRGPRPTRVLESAADAATLGDRRRLPDRRHAARQEIFEGVDRRQAERRQTARFALLWQRQRST